MTRFWLRLRSSAVWMRSRMRARSNSAKTAAICMKARPMAVRVTVGARMDFTIGAHYFAGVCKSDTLVNSSSGMLRTLDFADMRYFLTWDWCFGVWNMPDVRLVNGVRVKRYWHIYPADWSNQKKTYTTSPLWGWQILAQA